MLPSSAGLSPSLARDSVSCLSPPLARICNPCQLLLSLVSHLSRLIHRIGLDRVVLWEASLYLEVVSLLPLQALESRMQAQPPILRDRCLPQHLKPLLLTCHGFDHDGVETFDFGEGIELGEGSGIAHVAGNRKPGIVLPPPLCVPPNKSDLEQIGLI